MPNASASLVIVEAVPTPAPARTYRVSSGSSSERDQVLGVCVPCDLLVRGVVELVQSFAAERRDIDDATGRAAAARVLRNRWYKAIFAKYGHLAYLGRCIVAWHA